MPTATATFDDRAAADHAADALLAAGISPADISLFVGNNTRYAVFPERDGASPNAARGAAAGGIVGAGIGALAGGLLLGGILTAATGGAALPFLVGGPLAAAITGGISGTAVGSLVGGLIGAGVSEGVARQIDEDVRLGRIVVAVRTTDENDGRVRSLLRCNTAAETTHADVKG